MKYLLLDFGASFIKCAEFDAQDNSITKTTSQTSPFVYSNTLNRQDFYKIISDILLLYPNCKRVMSCSIMGGEWIDDTYYSWKMLNRQSKPDCLISKLFIGQDSYHIHKHHGSENETIRPLGYINDILFYSSLGDTFCVIESADLKENEYLINIGTGSQVITKQTINKYIPSGRALLVFANFFESINIDMFSCMTNISIHDIIGASLEIDLNVFEQSHRFVNGGKILNIKENNFTINNLLGSMLKSLVCQYKDYILYDSYTIKLTGGIPKKLPIIKNAFEYFYKNPVVVINNDIETHEGLSKFIRQISN